MVSLKETFIKPVFQSFLGSFLATAFISLFYLFKAPTHVPWVNIIIFFIFLFIAACLAFWVKSLFNYINKVLVYIHSTGISHLKLLPATLEKETDFFPVCMQMVDELLQKCVGAVMLKPQLVTRSNVALCSLTLFPERQDLIVRNIYDPDKRFGISVGDKFNRGRYFASWVFDEKQVKTINTYKDKSGSFAIISSFLPYRERETGALPFHAAIGIPLRLYGETKAALVIGSNEDGFLSKEDLIPTAIIGQYIISAYAHLKDYCPWHRKGWRDEKLQNNIRQHDFLFSFEDYRWTSTLEAKIKQIPSVLSLNNGEKLEILNQIKKKCENVFSIDTINSVFLCGTFNGWNISKNAMSKDPNENIWRCILHLPKGDYWYQFKVSNGKEDIWIFDPKFPLWLDGWKRIQSVLNLR